MAGTTLLAYGVVFVLLIGEIDLSISYVSGVAGVVVAQLQLPGSEHEYPASSRSSRALAAGTAIGAFQGSIIALIGVPSFVVTLAGFEIWQGVVLKSIPQGVLVIQDQTINDVSQYFFSDDGRLDHRRDRERRLRRGHAQRRSSRAGATASRSAIRCCSRSG